MKLKGVLYEKERSNHMKKTVLFLLLACAVCAGTFAQKTAEDYLKSGAEHFAKDDYYHTIADCTKAIKLNPGNARYLAPYEE
jgi:hypothetical protein